MSTRSNSSLLPLLVNPSLAQFFHRPLDSSSLYCPAYFSTGSAFQGLSDSTLSRLELADSAALSAVQNFQSSHLTFFHSIAKQISEQSESTNFPIDTEFDHLNQRNSDVAADSSLISLPISPASPTTAARRRVAPPDSAALNFSYSDVDSSSILAQNQISEIEIDPGDANQSNTPIFQSSDPIEFLGLDQSEVADSREIISGDEFRSLDEGEEEEFFDSAGDEEQALEWAQQESMRTFEEERRMRGGVE